MRKGAALAGAVLMAGCGGVDHKTAPAPKLARQPQIGVSCPRANSIRCDRVGLAIWLKHDPAHLSASIEGRPLKMRLLPNPQESHWEGFLQPAGLIDGALKVRPDRGRYYWTGKHPVYARVKISSGGRARTLRVPVFAGWG
jgi:hypothetical protein